MTQANQLDFLLNKASQYSNFITKDLEDLQAAMTDNAIRKHEKAEKRAKKRKGSDGKESSKKKSKKGSGDALKSALTKSAQGSAGGKPIFVQPPNLAEDCFLKDYQLEGVRWLASLFENGVSGILADEVCGKLDLSLTNACAFVGC
jgi:ATP-dependent DNA helicase